MKSGTIWVSAVLYMGLGIILVSIIIAIGVPAVDKLKDKSTISQTKDLFQKLDNNIREVYNEGEGSQRPIKLDFGRGQAKIDPSTDTISWELETKTLLSQPGYVIKEGNIEISTETTNIKENYLVNLKLNYSSTLDLVYNGTPSFSGIKRLSIINIGGQLPGYSLPRIEIIEI